MHSTTSRRGFMAGIAGAAAAIALPGGRLAWAGDILAPAAASAEVLRRETVSVWTNVVGGSLLNVGYSTPNGTRPATFGNRLLVWNASADTVPWERPPTASVPVLGDQPAGDQNITGVEISDSAYIVGYAIGPDTAGSSWSPYGNVVASAYIGPVRTDGAPVPGVSPTLEVRFVGRTSLVFKATFPAGFQVPYAGAWAGIWTGRTASRTVLPQVAAQLTFPGDSGLSGLDSLHLRSGQIYTLAIFSSGFSHPVTVDSLRPLAASVTFKIK